MKTRKLEPPELRLLDVEPTLDQMIACVNREIEFRQNVYQRRVSMGAMSPTFAENQIRLMQAVLKNLEGQKPAG